LENQIRVRVLHSLHAFPVAVLTVPANSSAQANHAKSAKQHTVDYPLTCSFQRAHLSINTIDRKRLFEFETPFEEQMAMACYYTSTDNSLVLRPLHYYRSGLIILTSSGAGERVHDGVFPPPIHKGGNGDVGSFLCGSIAGNFMVYQDRLETNLLQLFAHPETSERFSVISDTAFEVNIAAGQKQA